MELIIKGKKIDKYICTLHLTEFCSKEEGDHEANFVIYDEYDENVKDYVHRVLYFRNEDLESIKLYKPLPSECRE